MIFVCDKLLEISAALQVLEQIQESINASEDEKLRSQTKADLNLLISTLQNPILRSIATIQVLLLKRRGINDFRIIYKN